MSHEKPHQLIGLETCWNLLCKKSLTHHRSRWQAWLIRKVYDWCEWSGEFCTEFYGTFAIEDVARTLAVQRNLEARANGTGDIWEVKASPVNRILPYESVIYGTREYPATTIDDHYRAREPTQLAACRTVQELAVHFEDVRAEVDKTLALAKAAAGTL